MSDQKTQTNGTAIETYGTRDSIRELAERLKNMMPGTQRLTEVEARTIAQLAIAHGLDPFNGEIWGIKSEEGKWYGTMIGIKGLRKKAHEHAVQENGSYWVEEPVLVKPEKYSAAQNAIVYEIRLRDTVSMQAYGKSLNVLTSTGMPYKEAMELIGKPPVWIGIGIATPDEKSKMKLHARALKRAEADALKKRFDISFRGVTYTEGDDLPEDTPELDNAVEGEFEQQELLPAKQDPRDQQEIMKELGY